MKGRRSDSVICIRISIARSSQRDPVAEGESKLNQDQKGVSGGFIMNYDVGAAML
jgi:hypothetical protein